MSRDAWMLTTLYFVIFIFLRFSFHFFYSDKTWLHPWSCNCNVRSAEAVLMLIILIQFKTRFFPDNLYLCICACGVAFFKQADWCVSNPFVPNVPFIYPLKTSENLTIFWCFQGVGKGCIGTIGLINRKYRISH